MTRLSRKADYALLILSYLSENEVGGNARAVAEKFGLSRAFVANILKELHQKGFVTSHRGVKGGYTLARPANTISLAELLENIEDGFRLTMCNDADHAADVCSLTAVCTVKEPMAEVHRRLIEVLRNVTLAGLFGAHLPRPATLATLPVLNTGCCQATNHAVDPTPA